VPQCNACDVSPEAFSYKKWKNEYYNRMGIYNDVDVDNVQFPKVFHFSLSNTCNLACRMCFPGASSTFGTVIKRSEYLKTLYVDTAQDTYMPIEIFEGSFENATHVTISGGEPLIDKDCITLIDLIKNESKNIKSINFSTNLTKLNHDILEKLSTIDAYIMFSVSIDGPKHIQEYIRHGCSWDKIVENFHIIHNKYPKFKFAVNSTISALNVGYIPDTLKSLYEIEKDVGIKFNHLMISPVLYPTYLHPGAIPNTVKEMYKKKLESADIICSIPDSGRLIPTGLELLSSSNENPENFYKFINEFDKITDTNFNNIYPEFTKK
jgi:sulfatase maturation enzyme AslB (radical SAM superfamily)